MKPLILFKLKEFLRQSYYHRVPGLSIGLCRIAIGLMWIRAASWKTPPDFGQATDSQLWAWTQQAIQHPTFGWYKAFLEGMVLPHFVFFGYLLLALELYTGLSLAVGFLARLSAAIGLLLSLNLFIAMSSVPYEWPWAYFMLIMFHFIFLLTGPGQNLGLDQILLEKMANWPTSRASWKGFLMWLI